MNRHIHPECFYLNEWKPFRDFGSGLRCNILHVMPTFEEDAEEDGKDDYHSSQCKQVLNPFNLTIKSQISINISYQHIRSTSRYWARWQSGTGLFFVWLSLLFLYLILSKLWKQQGLHRFCNVWYFKTSDVARPMPFWCICAFCESLWVRTPLIHFRKLIYFQKERLLITANTCFLSLCSKHKLIYLTVT